MNIEKSLLSTKIFHYFFGCMGRVTVRHNHYWTVMGIDYLLQKPDEYVSIKATGYRHIAHMTVTTDGCNHIYTKPCSRFDDGWSVTSSAPGRTAMVVRSYTTFVNKIDDCTTLFCLLTKCWITRIQIFSYFFFRPVARLFVRVFGESDQFS